MNDGQERVHPREKGAPLPSARSSWLAELGIFLFFVAAAYAMLQPLPGLARTHTADIGFDDTYLNAHFTRVTHDFFLGLRPGQRLLDADFFFPHPLVFTTTDPCIGLSVFLLPLRAFTDDYLLLVNLGLFLSFPLAAHAMYLFVRDASGGPWERAFPYERASRRIAGILAGLLFAFSAYRFHQLDHPGLEQTQWLPYLAWALLKTARNPRFRCVFLLVPLIFETFAASSNLALYVAPAVLLLGLGILVCAAPKKRARFLAVVTVALLVAAVPLVPIYAEYIQGVGAYAIKRPLDAVKGYSATPAQLLAVPKYLAHWGPGFGDRLGAESATFVTVTALALALAAFTGTQRGTSERGLALASRVALRCLNLAVFPLFLAVAAASVLRPEQAFRLAIPLVLLAIVAFLRREKDPARAHAFLLATLGVLYAVFAFGPRVTWEGVEYTAPWDALMKLPGFESVRTPSRFWFVVTFAVAALAGLGVANLASYVYARRWLPRLRTWIPGRGNDVSTTYGALAVTFLLGTFGALALEETHPSAIPERLMIARTEIPSVYSWVRDSAPPGALLELPLYVGPAGQILERKREYFANVHKRPVVGGESGVVLPYAARISDVAFRSGNLQSTFEELHAAGLRTVLVHPTVDSTDLETQAIGYVTALGAIPGPLFAGTRTFTLPPPPKTRPFRWDQIESVVSFDGTAGAKVTLFLGNSEGLTAFTPGITSARVEIEIVGSSLAPFTVKLSVAPALIAAYGMQYAEAPFPIDFAAGRYELRYRVQLGDGPKSEAKNAFLDVAPSFPLWPPDATCTMVRLGGGRTASGGYRQLIKVETSARVDRMIAWVTAASGFAVPVWLPSGSAGPRLVALDSAAPLNDVAVMSLHSPEPPTMRCHL